MFRFMITFMYNDLIFICLASLTFLLCVLPTTIDSESTNCDDPYKWYTMHRQIKFVMIPDGSSSAPAYSLWKTLPSHCLPFCYTHLFFTYWFAFTVFLPLMGGKHASTHPLLSHLTAFFLLHLHCASGVVCCSTDRARRPPGSQRDAGDRPGAKLQHN